MKLYVLSTILLLFLSGCATLQAQPQPINTCVDLTKKSNLPLVLVETSKANDLYRTLPYAFDRVGMCEMNGTQYIELSPNRDTERLLSLAKHCVLKDQRHENYTQLEQEQCLFLAFITACANVPVQPGDDQVPYINPNTKDITK